MVVRASTGGLGADFNEILARHASASYKFGKTYASRKHAQWLLDMHNNTTVSLRDLNTYAALALHSRNS